MQECVCCVRGREDDARAGFVVIAGVFACYHRLRPLTSWLSCEGEHHPADMSSSPGATDSSQQNSLELESEHAQRVPGAEPGGVPPPQVKLKEKQKFFEEAFQQDMEQYLSTGYLQIAERRGSMSSMEVNVDMLEQMDLMDMSDHEALDVFLHSGGEDNSAASPVLGPDVESFTTEISLQVPTQAELRHKLCSLSSTGTDSASQEDPEAGEDNEEEVQPHAVLLEGAEPEELTSQDCGESRS